MKRFWRLIKTFYELKVSYFIGQETFWRLIKCFCSLMETFPLHKAIPIPGRELPFSIKKHFVSLNPPTLSIQKVFVSLNIPFRSGGELFVLIQKVFVSIKHLFISLKDLFITNKKVIDKGIKLSFQGVNKLFLSTIPTQQEQNSQRFVLFISERIKIKFNHLICRAVRKYSSTFFVL